MEPSAKHREIPQKFLRLRFQNIIRIIMDFNHPMAGKELNFTVTVADVRPATAEELEHGHVHGPGGHHH